MDSVLRIPDFRRLVLIKFFGTLGAQMQAVIVSWQLYQITRDPLSLGLIGLYEAAAFISCAMWAGHFSDRSEKGQVIRLTQVTLVVCAVVLCVLTMQESSRTWPFYAVIVVTGIVRSFLWTSAGPFAEMIVPRAVYAQAAAWNSTAWEVATLSGPAIGGILYGYVGPMAAYGGVLLSLGIALGYSLALHPCPPVPPAEKSEKTSDWASGLRFVFSTPILLTALSLDMFAVFFGGAVALLPVFAEMMNVGPQGLGLLRAAPSVGAVCMAAYQAYFPPFPHRGRTLLICVALFGVCMIGFGLSEHFWLSFAFLAFSGLFDNVSVVTRASILQAYTPNAMRGRVSAVNGIFIGSSNEIGAFESGLTARWMGPIPSVIFGGIMTLVTVGVVAWQSPRLRRLDRLPTE